MTTHNYFLPWEQQAVNAAQALTPDDRSGAVYLLDQDLRLAAEVAIVTQRPLLLQGEPGTGKSSFAPFVARNLNWRYYEATVTGRTEARDLLWKFDALARLRDAQAQNSTSADKKQYVTPGVLWWAFNRSSALDFSVQRHQKQGIIVGEQPTNEPYAEMNDDRDPFRAVVLIDEIRLVATALGSDLWRCNLLPRASKRRANGGRYWAVMRTTFRSFCSSFAPLTIPCINSNSLIVCCFTQVVVASPAKKSCCFSPFSAANQG